MRTKPHYSVPEGYFNDLNRRLSEIPAQEGRKDFASKLSPYIIMAACFLLSIVIGTAILKNTASPAKDKVMAGTNEEAFQEELLEYLIASDTPLAQLEDVMFNGQ